MLADVAAKGHIQRGIVRPNQLWQRAPGRHRSLSGSWPVASRDGLPSCPQAHRSLRSGFVVGRGVCPLFRLAGEVRQNRLPSADTPLATFALSRLPGLCHGRSRDRASSAFRRQASLHRLGDQPCAARVFSNSASAPARQTAPVRVLRLGKGAPAWGTCCTGGGPNWSAPGGSPAQGRRLLPESVRSSLPAQRRSPDWPDG